MYISGAQDGNISQITLNQQKIVNAVNTEARLPRCHCSNDAQFPQSSVALRETFASRSRESIMRQPCADSVTLVVNDIVCRSLHPPAGLLRTVPPRCTKL